jgi:hypothetical protein
MGFDLSRIPELIIVSIGGGVITLVAKELASRATTRDLKTTKDAELAEKELNLKAGVEAQKVVDTTIRDNELWRRSTEETQYLRGQSDKHQAAIDILQGRIHDLEIDNIKAETKRGVEVSQLREELADVRQQLVEALAEIKRLTEIIRTSDKAAE